MNAALEKHKLLDFLKKEIRNTLKKISSKELKGNSELLQKTKELSKLLSISEGELEKGDDNEMY